MIRRTLPLLLAALAAPVLPDLLPAQSLNAAVYATVGGGLAAHDNGPFSRRLRSFTPVNAVGDRLVYQTESFSNIGTTFNAELGVMVAGGLLVGASGEKLMFPTVHAITGPGNPQDDYVLTGMGGGLDLGWAVVNEDATLVTPFVQVGYYGYSLEQTNRQDASVPFFEGAGVAPESSATYTGSAARIALGVELVRFLAAGASTGSPDGLVLTARLTYGSMLERPVWERDGVEVTNGGHTPAYRSVQLSIGIGGALGWR